MDISDKKAWVGFLMAGFVVGTIYGILGVMGYVPDFIHIQKGTIDFIVNIFVYGLIGAAIGLGILLLIIFTPRVFDAIRSKRRNNKNKTQLDKQQKEITNFVSKPNDNIKKLKEDIKQQQSKGKNPTKNNINYYFNFKIIY